MSVCEHSNIVYNVETRKYKCLLCNNEVRITVGSPVEKCEHNIPTNQACEDYHWNAAIETAYALLVEACNKVDPKLVPYEVTNAMHKIKGLKK